MLLITYERPLTAVWVRLASPVTIRGDMIVDGYIRCKAAAELGLTKIPCIDISHLSEANARMLAISLNRLGETGMWEMEELKLELAELEIEGLDLTISGFSAQELDIIFTDDAQEGEDGEEDIPEKPAHPVSQLGDLWLLGEAPEILDQLQRWRDMGGTHASIDTMKQGLRTAQEHVDFLADIIQKFDR